MQIDCSKCKQRLAISQIGKQRYCKSCKAECMRRTRPKHSELDAEAKLKLNARSYLHVYVKRGKIKKMPCIICGSLEVEAHHNDYSKPLEVIWVCRKHHLEIHK
jgi:hypothetical protein